MLVVSVIRSDAARIECVRHVNAQMRG